MYHRGLWETRAGESIASYIPYLCYALLVTLAGGDADVSRRRVRLGVHDVLIQDLRNACVVQLRELSGQIRTGQEEKEGDTTTKQYMPGCGHTDTFNTFNACPYYRFVVVIAVRLP